VRGDDGGVYRDQATTELERVRRDLAVSPALAAPGSPVRVPITRQLDAAVAELGRRGGTEDGS
jgi:hypothetical protein